MTSPQARLPASVTPSYGIVPLTLDDLPVLCPLRVASLSPESSLRMMSSSGEVDKDATVELYRQDYTDLLSRPTTIAVKAVADDGSFLGSGVLLYHDAISGHQVRPCPAGADEQYWHYMQTIKDRTKDRAANGKPYYNMRNIFTVSEHRRKGIATALVKHLTQASSIPIVLTASEAGAALYSQVGFTTVDHVTWEKRGRPSKREPVMVFSLLGMERGSVETAGGEVQKQGAAPTAPIGVAPQQIQIEPVTAEDIPAMASLQTLVLQVFRRAFDSLWPPTTVSDKAVLDFHTRNFAKLLSAPNSVFVKATISGQIVGLGRAVLIAAESKRPPTTMSDQDLGPPGCDVEACRTISQDASRAKDKLANGGPYFSLTGIVTHPLFYRRGISTQVCEHLMRQPLFEGLPCIITASPDGAPMYRKMGFVEEDSVVWKGPDGTVLRTEPVMVATRQTLG